MILKRCAGKASFDDLSCPIYPFCFSIRHVRLNFEFIFFDSTLENILFEKINLSHVRNMINICKYTFGRKMVFRGIPTKSVYEKSFCYHNSLYNEDRHLIQVSSYVSGETNSGTFNSHIHAPNTPHLDITSGLTIENGFWIGYFHTHYGHFLLSTIQRLWSIDRDKDFFLSPNFEESQIYSFDYIQIIFEALEIDVSKITSLKDGTLLKNTTVNQPIFIENDYCYSKWSDFMKSISKKIINYYNRNESKSPVYISRSKVLSGTRHFEGEESLCETLKIFGIDTIHPEEMSFNEQLRFWNQNKTFIGFSGSSFITSAFFEGKNLIILNHDDYVFGSQLMIDKVSKNNSIYINIDNFISRNYPQNRSYSIINYNAIISQIMHAIRMFE
ncbi:glycosyltransferase family 61 protein [Gluconobacter cerinus]|uniref:glycosyltransferase family 61 protein n=1 Tax=Gluconobacter cerinus TaxID=38307 RepID=UPI001B8D9DEC|nr:glycosyltransferase family 61 protein [Gluconobacter cerinus]MBS1022115.1 glycosyltransferase family 61 protein [Gluconobacter cerinus]